MFRPFLPRRPSLRPLYAPKFRSYSTTSPSVPGNGGRQLASTSTEPSGPSSESSERPLKPPEHLRAWAERGTIALRQQTDTLVARLSSSFSQLGGKINSVTGYQEIEALKRRVVEQEARINASRKASRDAKVAYEEAVQQRSNSQREVNELLQRKSMWSDADVSRFTALVRQDHLYEQEEARAKDAVAATEDDVEREFSELMRSILARYHEEQVWSDKIRSVSTYGQLAVLGVNVFVFLLAIVLVEPWKRRRLAQTFERKVEELEKANLEVVTGGTQALLKKLDDHERVLKSLLTQAAASTEAVGAIAQQQADQGDARAHTTEDESRFVFTKEEVAVVASYATITTGVLGWMCWDWFVRWMFNV
ncbi:hypothetical protein BV25DRAFT_1805340 [Artomyces pyxidatus]|uniref:Uncharacterized protein n=1 Tax=Artomyces pyxidatus TaxID=48021 RepID=A0ACB8SZ18_9AGAM|nr:hypothetical protein BV25DRAFT_1805340 [Artomyces pyxidatus]